jgi:hypothetical protein
MKYKLLLDTSQWGQIWRSYVENNDLSTNSTSNAYIQFKDAAGIIDIVFFSDNRYAFIFENEDTLIEFKLKYV